MTVYEVGPRDGLQNEARTVPSADKLALVRALAAGRPAASRRRASSPRAGSRSSPTPPRSPPRCRGYRGSGTSSSCPTRRASSASARRSSAARSTRPSTPPCSCRRPSHPGRTSTAASPRRSTTRRACRRRSRGLRVRGYVSTAWGCPTRGGSTRACGGDRPPAPRGRLSPGVARGHDRRGTPHQTRDLVRHPLASARPEELALHMHDTRGTALANVLVGLEEGLTTFDASIGGASGCSLRARRLREPGDRGSRLHAAGHGHRDRRRLGPARRGGRARAAASSRGAFPARRSRRSRSGGSTGGARAGA